MSTEFYLIKDQSKEYYDLGKGEYWEDLFTYENNKISTKYNCPHKLYLGILAQFTNLDMSSKIGLKYYEDVSEDIYNWCGSDLVRLSNDRRDQDENVLGLLKETGSRFNKPESIKVYKAPNGSLVKIVNEYTGTTLALDIKSIDNLIDELTNIRTGININA